MGLGPSRETALMSLTVFANPGRQLAPNIAQGDTVSTDLPGLGGLEGLASHLLPFARTGLAESLEGFGIVICVRSRR